MASASDVPGKFDLVLNSQGYLLNDALETSYPFRTHRATYTYSPTFVERQNTQGSFGDNQQDFWMTSTQKDWSEGEQQRYARVNDADSARRYWTGNAIQPISTPGQVSMRRGVTSDTAAAAVTAFSSWGTVVAYATSTNLYTVGAPGSISNVGAHGVTATPLAMCADIDSLYLSAGTGKVRRCSSALAFSDFSATGADSLAYLNNTLYGYRNASNDLIRYDTAGTATSLYTWKRAIGSVPTVSTAKLLPFGGKLLILRTSQIEDAQADLWLYDGTAPAKVLTFPPNFAAHEMAVLAGTVFVSGRFQTEVDRAAIVYWSNGTYGELWRAISSTSYGGGLCSFEDGIVFGDSGSGSIYFYSPGGGGFHTISTSGIASETTYVRAAPLFFAQVGTSTSVKAYPSAAVVTSSTVTSSLFDFDSSLDKLFRGIKLDFDSATDGNGGTVDIAYRVGDVDGSYTTLQTTAVAGTEYTLSGISGRSISVKVTLNKGTSTNGPVLKRVSVRAAPLLTRFKQREYVLSLAGTRMSEAGPIRLRDNSTHTKSGREMADDLVTASSLTTPFTISDRFSSYTGIVETLELFEDHPAVDDPSKSGTFVARVVAREV